MRTTNIDRTNARILTALNRNARATYSDIAAMLGCSINTVRDRMFAMERRGLIRRYEAVVDEKAVGNEAHVLAMVRATGPIKADLESSLPKVQRIELASGPYAAVMEIHAPSIAEVHRILKEEVYPLGFSDARIVPLQMQHLVYA